MAAPPARLELALGRFGSQRPDQTLEQGPDRRRRGEVRVLGGQVSVADCPLDAGLELRDQRLAIDQPHRVGLRVHGLADHRPGKPTLGHRA